MTVELTAVAVMFVGAALGTWQHKHKLLLKIASILTKMPTIFQFLLTCR